MWYIIYRNIYIKIKIRDFVTKARHFRKDSEESLSLSFITGEIFSKRVEKKLQQLMHEAVKCGGKETWA